MRGNRARCKIGPEQDSLEDIEPPRGICRRIIGAALAQEAMGPGKDWGSDFLPRIFRPPPAPSTRGKSIQRRVTIGPPGIEPRRWIVRPIRRVGIGLRLKAKRVILAGHARIFSRAGP